MRRSDFETMISIVVRSEVTRLEEEVASRGEKVPKSVPAHIVNVPYSVYQVTPRPFGATPHVWSKCDPLFREMLCYAHFFGAGAPNLQCKVSCPASSKQSLRMGSILFDSYFYKEFTRPPFMGGRSRRFPLNKTKNKTHPVYGGSNRLVTHEFDDQVSATVREALEPLESMPFPSTIGELWENSFFY